MCLSGQIERVHVNGTRHIIYSNGQQRTIKPDNSEEMLLNDGRVCTLFVDATQKIEYPNGDIEYKTDDYTVCCAIKELLCSSTFDNFSPETVLQKWRHQDCLCERMPRNHLLQWTNTHEGPARKCGIRPNTLKPVEPAVRDWPPFTACPV